MSGQAVGFIFARGGSKGLPGKNIRPLAGKPLIAHAIEAARAARGIGRVVVSTDDAEIAAKAREWGAEIPFMRPPELAGDDSPEWLAWRHALEAVDGAAARPLEMFVSIPPTSPLRQAGDIDACVERFSKGDVDVVITVTPAARNPYFNMVTVNEGGLASIVIPTGEKIEFRKSVPPIFDVTTVCYVVSPDFLRQAEGIFEGRVGVVEVPPERALDIDTEMDFHIARALIGAVKK